jgi:carboxyl-terminal processing protease
LDKVGNSIRQTRSATLFPSLEEVWKRFGRVANLLLVTVVMLAGVIGGILLAREFPLGLLTQQDISRLTGTMSWVAGNYVDPVAGPTLVDHALEGLFERLDSNSQYLDPVSMRDISSEAHGHYAGIGIEISLIDGYFTVASVMSGSPAERASIAINDRITSIDGQSLRSLRIRDVKRMLRGTAGTDVMVTLVRGGAERIDVKLMRERITLDSVAASLPLQGIPLLRVSVFHEHTAGEIRSAITRQRDKGGELKGLLLDFRGNPGGLLPAAVEVADLFLDEGLIVLTSGRDADSHAQYSATRGDVLAGLPVGILIDAGTASAAEVVAAALQDHRRALLFGTRSHGKGSVQTLFAEPGQRGVKLTTARYVAPSGRSIDGVGVEPDVIWHGDYDALPAHAHQRLLDSSNRGAAL